MLWLAIRNSNGGKTINKTAASTRKVLTFLQACGASARRLLEI
jgi:hypothetical protein